MVIIHFESDAGFYIFMLSLLSTAKVIFPLPTEIQDQDLLRRQLGVLKLLVRVHQKNLFQDLADVANNFTLDVDNYEVRFSL